MEIREYQKGDEIKIYELFESTFGKKISPDYWNWLFVENPTKLVMIKLMWDNDVLAGHYAVSPLFFSFNNEKILSALSLTTMTNPLYVGKGIFTTLADKLYKDFVKKEHLKSVWGFPNTNSHYAFIKNLKWQNLEVLPTLSLNIEKFKISSNNLFSDFNLFNEEHSKATHNVLSKYLVFSYRNSDYMNWRYTKHPLNKYDFFEKEINGINYFAVTKIFNSFSDPTKMEVDILELILPEEYDIIYSCISDILRFYENKNLIKINIWMPINDIKHIYLEKIGFTQSLPITYSGILVLDDKYNQLKNNNNWYISMGDSDIF
ncbi:MAG: GNAT family N-acetyltransferase [Bacteroidota bacterium]|jgi:hypothetical protein